MIGLLALDTIGAAPTAAFVGVGSDGQVRVTSEPLGTAREIAESLPGALSRLCPEPLEQLAAICVCTGPGSYTGVRSALSLAMGVVSGTETPLVGISLFGVLTLLQLARPEAISRSEKSESVAPRVRYVLSVPANRNELFVAVRAVECVSAPVLRAEVRCEAIALESFESWEWSYLKDHEAIRIAVGKATAVGPQERLARGESGSQEFPTQDSGNGEFAGPGAEAVIAALRNALLFATPAGSAPDFTRAITAEDLKRAAAAVPDDIKIHAALDPVTPWYEKGVVAKTLEERGIR